MLILAALREVRMKRDLQPRQLSKLSGIPPARLNQLELTTRNITEPFFREAVALARVLNVTGIRELLGPNAKLSGDLTGWDIGATTTVDLDLWRSGLDLDLATACRIAVAFGLPDPYELAVPPIDLQRQLWATISERAGGCSWCGAEGITPHLPTCLPANIWGERSREMAPNVSFAFPPRQAGKAHGVSSYAQGLRRIRADYAAKLGRDVTQAEMGAMMNANSDQFAKWERCVIKMPVGRAKVLANQLGIDFNDCYRP